MLPLFFRTQPHAHSAGSCVDFRTTPETDFDSRDPKRAGDSPFSTVLEGAVTASATPPLAPWPMTAMESQQRPSVPPAAETRIDRDRRHSRRRQRG